MEASQAARLRGWLALVLILAAAAQMFLAWHLWRGAPALLVEREAEMARDFLASIVKAEQSQDKLFAEPAPSATLTSFSHHLAALPGLVRANLYSPDGFIRYSTEPALIGLKFEGNGELAQAFKGKLDAGLEVMTYNAKAEHLALNRYVGQELIEAYLPLTDESGNTFAVVEYYRLPGEAAEKLEAARRGAYAAIGLALLMLAIGLYGLAPRKP